MKRALIDVENLMGERIFVEVEPVDDSPEGHAYIGTLCKINERNIALSHWILVNEWTPTHIVDYTNGSDVTEFYWSGDIWLCTYGFLREVKTIEKNLRKGDPHGSTN